MRADSVEAVARSDSASTVADSRCCWPAVRASSTSRAAVSCAVVTMASASARAASSSPTFAAAAVSRSSCDSARRTTASSLARARSWSPSVRAASTCSSRAASAELISSADCSLASTTIVAASSDAPASTCSACLRARPASARSASASAIEATGLLAQLGEVGGEPLGLLPGLALQLVGHLLGAREQGSRGLARGGCGGIEGHLPAPFARVPRPTLWQRDHTADKGVLSGCAQSEPSCPPSGMPGGVDP